MRSPVSVGLIALGCSIASGLSVVASEGVATIVASVSVAPRTSLTVSADVLEFDVAPGSDVAVSAVEFTAAARVRPDTPVKITVQTAAGLSGPGGAADVEASLTVSAEGAESPATPMSRAATVTAAQWVGGGVRSGRLVFRLRAAVPGAYSVPVRLTLTVP